MQWASLYYLRWVSWSVDGRDGFFGSRRAYVKQAAWKWHPKLYPLMKMEQFYYNNEDHTHTQRGVWKTIDYSPYNWRTCWSWWEVNGEHMALKWKLSLTLRMWEGWCIFWACGSLERGRISKFTYLKECIRVVPHGKSQTLHYANVGLLTEFEKG